MHDDNTVSLSTMNSNMNGFVYNRKQEKAAATLIKYLSRLCFEGNFEGRGQFDSRQFDSMQSQITVM